MHCIDGRPADLSFLYAPNFATLMSNGKSVQTKDLKPNTPVHVEFTQSLGIRKAYKIFVANPNGHGLVRLQELTAPTTNRARRCTPSQRSFRLCSP